jgi:hypothetical protein
LPEPKTTSYKFIEDGDDRSRGVEDMDNTEKKLRKLFDFQRFEKEPGL